jgi:hypothetical protein
MNINYVIGLAGLLVLVFIMSRKGGEPPISKLVRQTARWATAAQQDQSPLVALLHANYAAGYLWALKDIATDTEINKVAGINLKQFEEHIVNVQDMTTKKVLKACPSFAGEVDLYLSTIAGEGI